MRQLGSLKLTAGLITAFLLLFLLQWFWSAFPGWLYIPAVILFYGNLAVCLFIRLPTMYYNTGTKAGYVLFHGGLALVIAGALVTALFKWEGGFEICPGQSFIDSAPSYLWGKGPQLGQIAYSNQGFALEKVLLEHNPDGSIRKFACVTTDNSVAQHEKVIESNHPLPLGKGHVYLSNRHGRALKFKSFLPEGNSLEGTVHFSPDETVKSFKVPGLPYTLTAEFSDILQNNIRITGFPGHMLRKKHMTPGETIILGMVLLKYEEALPWVGLTMVRDPGKPFVYAGFIVFCIGLALFYIYKFANRIQK